eukprot:3049964-Prymnesium_polylepis.1
MFVCLVPGSPLTHSQMAQIALPSGYLGALRVLDAREPNEIAYALLELVLTSVYLVRVFD